MTEREILKQMLEAWHTNNRTNLFLIANISAEGMKCTLSKRGGRNVVRQFAHMHNNRVWHLENRAPDLADGLYTFETHEEPDTRTLKKHLKQSAERLAEYWSDWITGKNRRRTFKKGVITYLGYFIAHESHHRGSILLTLKQCGYNLDQKTRYAIWNWDKI